MAKKKKASPSKEPPFQCSFVGRRTGWICPRCNKVHAPDVKECDCAPAFRWPTPYYPAYPDWRYYPPYPTAPTWTYKAETTGGTIQG